MPVFSQIFTVFLFIVLVRCPLVAQQLSTRLAALSFNCTKENRLVKNTYKKRILTERDVTYLAAGVEYYRATTIADAKMGTIEKQSRIGIPVMAGYRFGKVSLEAGGFFGLNMTRPQQGSWFANPETPDSINNRHMTPAATLLMGLGLDVKGGGTFNIRYLHFDDLPNSNILGKLQIGWRWSW